jgi:GNAT superfamily N-acetyltransferase
MPGRFWITSSAISALAVGLTSRDTVLHPGTKTSGTNASLPAMNSQNDAIPHEPPVAGNEVDTLLGGLDRQRSYVAWKCGNLDSAARRRGSRVTSAGLSIAPANHCTWADLRTIFGTTGSPGHCYCQWFKVRDRDWRSLTDQDRQDRFRQQTNSGNQAAEATTGLVAYLGDEPVGWAAVEPRTAYARLLRTRTPWSGRDEDKSDSSVWAVTCFVIRAGYRRRGISYALAAATVEFARARGARALEAYAMETEPGKEITWGELYVGARQVFAAAGFAEVSHPSPRRAVMRIDFTS